MLNAIMQQHTYDHLMDPCPGLPGWAGTRRNIHPFTPTRKKKNDSHRKQGLLHGSSSLYGALSQQGLWEPIKPAYNQSRPVSQRGSPYSITERMVPELILILGSQPAGDVSHKPGSRLPLLSARPAVTPATLKRAATNFAAWWTEAQWVWTVCLRLLHDSVAAAIWTRALLRLSPAC